MRHVELRAERNHLMMPAETGLPIEYARLPNLIDGDLWQEIGAWIIDLSRTDP